MRIEKYISMFEFVEHWIQGLSVANNVTDLLSESILSRKLDTNFKIVSVLEKNEMLMGLLSLDVSATIKTNSSIVNDSPAAMKISVSILGLFKAPIEMGNDNFEKMLSLNGTSVLYSIARSVIIDTSSKSVAEGMIRLPMLNVVAFQQAKENAEMKKKQNTKFKQ